MHFRAVKQSSRRCQVALRSLPPYFDSLTLSKSSIILKVSTINKTTSNLPDFMPITTQKLSTIFQFFILFVLHYFQSNPIFLYYLPLVSLIASNLLAKIANNIKNELQIRQYFMNGISFVILLFG